MALVKIEVLLDTSRKGASPERIRELLDYLSGGRLEVDILSKDEGRAVLEVDAADWGELTTIADGYSCTVERI